MHLIVGLGNPGKEYESTRHNIGFMALDNYLDKYNIKLDKDKFGGIFTKTKVNNEEVIFLKPQKYINLSGEVISKIIDYYKVPIENILILHDDLDLEPGIFKIRETGGTAGHNGLANIEQNLATKDYKRIRIGIGKNDKIDTVNYVLGKPTKKEKEEIDKVLDLIPNIIDDYFKLSFSNLMNKYN